MIPIAMLLRRAAPLCHPLLQRSQELGGNILERLTGNRSPRNSDLLSFYLLYVCHTCICSFGWDNEGIFWLLPNSPTAAYLQSQSAGHEQLISRLNGIAFIASHFPSLPSQAAIPYLYSSWAKLFYYEITQSGHSLFQTALQKGSGTATAQGPSL